MTPSNVATFTPRPGIDISVIVPIGRRRVDIRDLHAEYRAALERTGRRFEFIYVVDGNYADANAAVAGLVEAGEPVTGVYLTRFYGESTALMAGFEHAGGAVVLTLPAYRQIEPDDISKLLGALDTADIAVAHRWPRAGGFGERLRRNVFHSMVSGMSARKLHDLGCSARAMKRRVLEEIDLYGDQHRLLPVLADRQGFRTVEVQVRQSPLDRNDKGYSPKEYLHRLLDIFAVFFLVRFTKKPLRFFGMVGVTMLVAGSLVMLYVIVERLFFGVALADRPVLLVSSLTVVLGLQLFALGLLGELIIFTHAGGLKDYQIDRVIEYPRIHGGRGHSRDTTGTVNW
jgi:glycosyltransferase involved in cell wall biosynthesis